MKVIVMRGVPGSGKSHFAKSLEGAVKVFSTDAYPGLYEGNQIDFSKLALAHAWNLKSFIVSCQDLNKSSHSKLVVDNTNTTVAELAPYVAIAQAYGAEVEIVRVECDLEVAAARNTHGVPLATIQRMDANIKAASLPPFWPKEKIITQGAG